jgi:hypothetical protein
MEFTKAFKATGELSTVFCTRYTISRKASNPKELYKIMKKLFRAVGSSKKAEQMEDAQKQTFVCLSY